MKLLKSDYNLRFCVILCDMKVKVFKLILFLSFIVFDLCIFYIYTLYLCICRTALYYCYCWVSKLKVTLHKLKYKIRCIYYVWVNSLSKIIRHMNALVNDMIILGILYRYYIYNSIIEKTCQKMVGAFKKIRRNCDNNPFVPSEFS